MVVVIDDDEPAPPEVDEDVIAAFPMTMQNKAKRLDRSRRIDTRRRPIPGSNMTGLLNDMLRKRKKIDPVGWQTFPQQLRCVNLPMELISNVDRQRYLRQKVDRRRYLRQAATPPTTRNRSPKIPPRWTPLTQRHMVRSRTVLDDWESY